MKSNFNKSLIYFNSNVNTMDRLLIEKELEVRSSMDFEKYLRLLMVIGRN